LKTGLDEAGAYTPESEGSVSRQILDSLTNEEKRMEFKMKYFATCLVIGMMVLVGIGQQAQAATVYNYCGLGAEGAADVNPGVSSTDLVNGITPTVTGTGHGSFGGPGVVSDGVYLNTAAGRYLDISGLGSSNTFTFTLGTVSAVGEVRVYTADSGLGGNLGPRNAYDYDLRFLDSSDVQIGSTINVFSGYGGTLDAAGSGTAHVRGTVYSAASPPDYNQTHYTQVLDSGGVLASGVKKVLLTFRPTRNPGDDATFGLVATADGSSWITEIDVFEAEAAAGTPGSLIYGK